MFMPAGIAQQQRQHGGGGSAPVLESYSFSDTAGVGADITISMPSGIEDDDLLIAFTGCNYGSAGASDHYGTVSGWNKLTGDYAAADANNWWMAAFWKIASGAQGSIVIPWVQTDQRQYGGCLRISGAHQTAPFDAEDHTSTAYNNSNATMPSLSHSLAAGEGLGLAVSVCGCNVTGTQSESSDDWSILSQKSTTNYGTPAILTLDSGLPVSTLPSCALSRSTTFSGWGFWRFVIKP